MHDITFTNKDGEGLHMLYNDALVARLFIGKCKVKRVLIYNRSLVDVIFLSTFRRMKWDEKYIKKSR